MNVPIELQERINSIFKEDINFRNSLLSGDVESIRQLTIISERGVDPIDIIESYKSQDFDSIYNKAKELIEIKKLYIDMCEWYQTEKLKSNRNR